MSHKQVAPTSSSAFNVPVSTGETARKKIDSPKSIGFRGRHAHGKGPNDPVYPTRQLGPSPRMGFVDWRTGGRALLVAAMGAIEGKFLRTRSQILKWQSVPVCSPQCGVSCHKARNRVLCAWFTPGSAHEHSVRMTGLLTKFKGSKNFDPANPPFRPMSQVALRNRFAAVPMKLGDDGLFSHLSPPPDPAFELDPELRNPDGYASDEDPEETGKDLMDLARYDPRSMAEVELVSRNFHI